MVMMVVWWSWCNGSGASESRWKYEQINDKLSYWYRWDADEDEDDHDEDDGNDNDGDNDENEDDILW